MRKYTVVIDDFLVEGTVFLDRGVAMELAITDIKSGVVGMTKEHGSASLSMRRSDSSKESQIVASCLQLNR